jgi:hypothetical protein
MWNSLGVCTTYTLYRYVENCKRKNGAGASDVVEKQEVGRRKVLKTRRETKMRSDAAGLHFRTQAEIIKNLPTTPRNARCNIGRASETYLGRLKLIKSNWYESEARSSRRRPGHPSTTPASYALHHGPRRPAGRHTGRSARHPACPAVVLRASGEPLPPLPVARRS